jgi:hypothetical protein
MTSIDEITEDKITLKGEAALALCRQGKAAWNQWVEDNPDVDVDFYWVDFGKERNEETTDIDFKGFKFPKGGVSFRSALFGEGNVSFNKAQFGEGNVDFCYAQFGVGTVDFSYSQFGNGNVYFSDTQFGDGWVNFTGIQLGKGKAYFVQAQFGIGPINFSLAQFGEGEVAFINASFGEGQVNFGGTEFGGGNVDFSGAHFNGGNIDFSNTKFRGGNITFIATQFGKGNVNFQGANFGNGTVCFNQATFEGSANFSLLVNIGLADSLSFKGASFDKNLDLSGNILSCVVDLTGTKTVNHVSLDDLHCQLPVERIKRGPFVFNKAQDPDDIARLRRLKEIAENNKDHERALAFHADEMRAKRWHKNSTRTGPLFDYTFDKLSNYGRSELRPLVWLSVLWFLFGCYYFLVSGNVWIDAGKKFAEAMAFSGSQMLPIVPGSRVASMEGLTILFFNNLSPLLHLVTFIQSIMSLMLIFLIGLALRNRFRL